MMVIYNVLVFVVVRFLLVPWHAALLLVNRCSVTALNERLGRNHIPPANHRRILIHAVSVGEVAAAEPLVREILRIRPQLEIVLSTGNEAGYRTAMRLQDRHPHIIHVQFLPWDEKGILTSWLRQLRPDLVAIVETELWPNLICACKRHGIPLCILNGRVYPRDVSRYRLAYPFFEHVLSHVDWIGVQSEREKAHFIDIGARADRMELVGNLKFESTPAPPSSSEVFSRQLRGRSVIAGGSTHHPEEQWLLESLVELRTTLPELQLILAPRNPKRARVVEHQVQRYHLAPQTMSTLGRGEGKWDVLILDEVGWLTTIYGFADVVVIGGSFINHGGHNLLEAAVQGRAIIIGPHVQHFQDIVEEFELNGALVRLKSHHELAASLITLLNNHVMRRELGTKARMLIGQHSGIALRYADKLLRVLEGRHLPPAISGSTFLRKHSAVSQ